MEATVGCSMRNMCTIRIERVQNGYVMEITDPEIVKQNRDKESYGKGWRDPDVKYTFDEASELLEFLTKNIDKALPMDEYDASFDAAVKEASDD